MKYLDSLFSLKNKIALVTGAARGNGRAISEALLKAGAKVILVDKLERDLKKTTDFFCSQKLDAFLINCDISHSDEIKNISKFIMKKFGSIDILVNNAGITKSHSLFDYPEEDWEETHKINLKAPFLLSKEIGKMMKKQKSGVIINITSINSEAGFPDNPAYIAFKGALKQLTKSLAYDLGKYGIRVNNVGPGYFKTQMTKKSWNDPKLREERTNRTILGRWGIPEDLAGIIIFLASDASSYITGQDFYVDGGWLAKGL